MGMGSPTTFASSPVANYKSGVRNMEMQHKPLLLLRAKVVVVGDACVGKTAITQMFNSGGHNYPKNYIMV
jgi:GTPase SAR1 family protein